MSEAYRALRGDARALALATIFDKPEQRDITCDLLQLGLELEKIIEIASEPMLAMIRMQWWVDLYDATTIQAEAPDFAKRLHAHQAIAKADLLQIVHMTQDSLQSPSPAVAWEAVFYAIAAANGWSIDKIVLTRLGRNFSSLYRTEDEADYQPIADSAVKQASKGNYGFPRLVNLLTTRQISGKPNQDFLLVFRYLLRVLF